MFSKDETGIYKNLLQETAHRAGLDLPVYTSVRSGPGHVPTFSCTVELAGMRFNGESAKTKKQAEKNAAIAAWFSLRKSELILITSKFKTFKIHLLMSIMCVTQCQQAWTLKEVKRKKER